MGYDLALVSIDLCGLLTSLKFAQKITHFLQHISLG
jgi:hypothetical protein